MAAASSIARWLLDEASSGTTPTECADDQSSNTLTIDYSSGDAAWTSVAGGNGLDFTATAGASNAAVAILEDISTNGDIGSSLDGVSEVSFILRTTIDAGASSGSRLFALGTDSGDTDLSIVVDTTALRIRWDQESGGDDDTVSYAIPTGITTIGVSIDTFESTGADRCKVYYDGVLESSVGGTLTSESTLDGINATSRNVSLGNRQTQNRGIDGKVYYTELFNGVLTATQHSDAHTALASDNDANWVSGGDTEISASTEALVITEQAATISLDIDVAANVEALAITEYAATIDLDVAINIDANTESLVITENAATIALDVNINAATESLVITEYQATIDVGSDTTISASTEALVITEQQASIGFDVNVASGTESLTLTTNAASIQVGTNVFASVASLVITENSASITRDIGVNASTEALVITGNQATIDSSGATTLTAQDITNIVDAIFSHIVENSETFNQQLRLIRAEAAGELAVTGTTVTIRDAADTKDRITATVDSNGQRTTITTDVS